MYFTLSLTSTYILILFHSSSVVEQSAVNRSVVGSNPTCGATESCPSGRRSTIGNRVGRLRGLEGSNPSLSATFKYNIGPLVKRLRHRPFTAVSRVRIPYGSPTGGLAQLGEHLPYKQGVAGSSPASSTILNLILSYIAGWSSLAARWAHNPKVVGSNPTPATNFFNDLC